MLKKICLCALILFILFMLCACGKTNAEEPMLSWQEQFDLGQRYLAEGKYEEAIIAFQALIEIDPKQADVYLLLAQAYEAQGDSAAASEVRAQGYAETNDPRLMPEEEPVQEPVPSETEAQETVFTEHEKAGEYLINPLRWEEVIVAGVPLVDCTVEQVQALFAGEPGPLDGFVADNGPQVWAEPETDRFIAMYFEVRPASLEFRGLHTGMEQGAALTALGFSDAGIAFAEQAGGSRYGFAGDVCVEIHEDTSMIGEQAGYDFGVLFTYMLEDKSALALFAFHNGTLSYCQVDIENMQ